MLERHEKVEKGKHLLKKKKKINTKINPVLFFRQRHENDHNVRSLKTLNSGNLEFDYPHRI